MPTLLSTRIWTPAAGESSASVAVDAGAVDEIAVVVVEVVEVVVVADVAGLDTAATKPAPAPA